MYAKTLLLALFAALAALTTVQACSDDKDFTWTYTFNGKEFTQHCSFLSNGNSSTNAKRRNNHCSKNNVKRNCKKSCDNCGSNEPSTCKDTNFTWKSPSGVVRTCSFLSRLNKVTRKDYCSRTLNGKKVKKVCRKSCDNCKSSQPSKCEDSSSFTFTGGQPCSFLDQVSVARKEQLCGRTFNGIKAKRACRKSCNNCKSSEAELETTVDVVEE